MTPRTAACQAPLRGDSPSKNTGVGGLAQGNIPTQGSPTLQADSLPYESPGNSIYIYMPLAVLLIVLKDQEERSSDPKELDPDFPRSVQEFSAEAWVGGGLPQAWRH